MFAVFATTLLCWLAVSHSAPLSYENLLQPLDRLDFHHLEGSWALVAGSLHNASHVDQFNNTNSVTVVFGNFSDSSEISFTRTYSVEDSCRYAHTNVTLEGSGFNLQQFHFIVTFLKASCDDCLVMKFDNLEKEPQRMYLLSKTREVEQKEMEEFTAQAACLNMTLPVLKDPTKMLCPDQISI